MNRENQTPPPPPIQTLFCEQNLLFYIHVFLLRKWNVHFLVDWSICSLFLGDHYFEKFSSSYLPT